DHKGRKIHFPIICLTVSGGHNELVLIKSHSERKLLGETLDDAAGEAFDKVARLLDLGYPGGPAISKAAMLATNKTDIKINKLPRAWLDKEWEKKIGKPMNFDFSFSGIKTAVRYLVEDLCGKKVTKKTLAKYQPYIALEFEQAVCEVMARKLVVAGKKWKAKEIHLAGGVSANTRLRSKITEEIAHEFPRQAPIFRFPEKISYCTDNAAMIGAAAYWIGKVMKPEKLKAVASDFRI
ncbi:MAG: hypothetical protein NTZ80_00830, partial [Patescibacteria group bacterium]|nr:hypothetical protein [Patescibacteria group bacterium]